MNEGQAHQTHDVAEARDPQDVAIDPVCGMEVNKATATHRYEHGSQPYFFCGARCREKFVAAPESYLAKREAPPPPTSKSTIFTCPMHPEIRQEGPGSCPICGMALEPLDATAEAGPNVELLDMSRRFWVAQACWRIARRRDGTVQHGARHDKRQAVIGRFRSGRRPALRRASRHQPAHMRRAHFNGAHARQIADGLSEFCRGDHRSLRLGLCRIGFDETFVDFESRPATAEFAWIDVQWSGDLFEESGLALENR